MPFGIFIAVKDQAQEDKLVDGIVKDQGPVPLDAQGQPTMTDKQFATQQVKALVIQTAQAGHVKFAQNAAFDAAQATNKVDFAGA